MNILIGLVVAMFIITGAYVGYHASQQPVEEAEGHDITMEFQLFNENMESEPVLQYQEFKKLSL
jgi:hypothetical protein